MKKRILIIEDSTSIREELNTLLEFENYEVLEADNGLTGYEMAEKYIPDLILCDVIMPDMDGYEEFRALRKNPKTAHIPFIFLTAMTSTTSHMRALGSEGYITKPFEFDSLLEKIKNLVPTEKS